MYTVDDHSKAIREMATKEANSRKITEDVGEPSSVTKDDNWDGYDHENHPERFKGNIRHGTGASRDGSNKGGEIKGTPRSDNEGKAEGTGI